MKRNKHTRLPNDLLLFVVLDALEFNDMLKLGRVIIILLGDHCGIPHHSEEEKEKERDRGT